MSDPNSRSNAPSGGAQLAQRFSQGVTLHENGQFVQAEQAYRDIISIEPNQIDTLHMLGILHIQTGRPDSGFALIDRALAIRPDFFDAHHNRGLALLQLNRPAEALVSFDKVLAIRPDHVEAAVNRGFVLASLKRPLEALASFDRALAIRPDNAHALLNRGASLSELKRLPEALASLDKALAIEPDNAQAHFNRGAVLKELKRPDEAVGSFDMALSIRPDYAEALINRGVVFKMLGRTQDALAEYAKALVLWPNSVEALISRGVALNELGRLDEAEASYDDALAIDPGSALARFNKSLILLLTGRFEAGWPLYESRKALSNSTAYAQFRAFAGPSWNGEVPLSEKRLFLYCEQGFGDTIQFSRYASLAADRGADVVLSIQDELLPLFDDFDARVQVIGGMQPPVDFDYQAPLLSLPFAFGTTAQTIPTASAYLRAPADKTAAWANRLGQTARPRIGLAWSGGAAHENDRNRSIPFSLIAPLLSFDADWICVQKEVRDSDREALAEHPELKLFGPDLADFSDTAALIANLDLVIAVDTSVAHLAAALARPTWILLPFAPDWRWLLGRDDSPWHPTARLLRQPAPCRWDLVIERVQQELTAGLGKGVVCAPPIASEAHP